MNQETSTNQELSAPAKRRLLLAGLLFGLALLLVAGVWFAAKKAVASFYNTRGYAQWEEGNNEDAIMYYAKAIELNPDYAEAYKNQGVALWSQSEFEENIGDKWELLDEALTNLDKAVALNPDDPYFYWERGRIHAAHRQFDEAISDYTKAIDLNPDFAPAYVGRALVKAFGVPTLIDATSALDDFNKALELGSVDPIIYYNRGKTYLWLNEPENAIADFNKSIEVALNKFEAYSARALAYNMAGNKEAALADYRLYLELEPKPIGRELIEKNIAELEAELTE